MLREIEAILREIARQQGVPIPADQPLGGAGQRLPAPLEYPVEAEIVEAEPVHEGIATKLRTGIDTSDVTQGAARMGAEVGLADDKLDAHLHAAFDHRVGNLQARSDESAQPETAGARSFAAEIVDMFRDPRRISQAIILNEILNPPTQRW
jgi:hypothetical protein